MEVDLEKIYVNPPKAIKYGMIFPISTKPKHVKFHASLKLSETPWEGKYLTARISKISEKDLKMLREIKNAICSQRITRWKTFFKFLKGGIIFAKFEKGNSIWIGDDSVQPPQDHEMRGEITLIFQHVFIGNPHKSISCILERFSC